MLFLIRFTHYAFRTASVALLGLTMAASATPVVAQNHGDMAIVPRVGFIHATRELGRVHLNGNPFDVGRVGPGLQIGAGLQRVLGSAGWALEAQVMRSLFARASSRYRGPLLIRLARDLPVTITSATMAVATPRLGPLPTYLKSGVGVKRHEVRGKGGNAYLQGGTSDTQFTVLVGVGIRWRIADTFVEVELTDFGSYADFGIDRRFTNELSLTLGLPIRFD